MLWNACLSPSLVHREAALNKNQVQYLNRMYRHDKEPGLNYSTLSTFLDDRILTVTLNRPDNLNAFTVTMANELVELFSAVRENDDIAAVVVTGAGRAFCAGMDLSVQGNVFGLDESLTPTLEDLDHHFDDPQMVNSVRDTGGRVSLAILACDKPVIAAINGAAVGIGATMTLAMDVRLAADTARIGFVFGKIGIVPEACSSWFLPRIVGVQQALDWVYSGEILTAEQARAGGLVKDVVPVEQLLDTAIALAKRYTGNRSPVATAISRRMLMCNPALPHPAEAHKIESLGVFYTSMKDGREGVRAFLDKRDPEFTSKVSTDMPEIFR